VPRGLLFTCFSFNFCGIFRLRNVEEDDEHENRRFDKRRTVQTGYRAVSTVRVSAVCTVHVSAVCTVRVIAL
jgi:hypothetical protein